MRATSWDVSGKTNSIGKDSGRSYDGRINGCGLVLEPGNYVITARRDWHANDPRIIPHKTDLIVRVK